MRPYGDSSPMGLVWTFVGASVGYEIFSGLFEAISGYLLFWRRTALVGSLMAPRRVVRAGHPGRPREAHTFARWVRLGVNLPSLTTIQRANGVAVRMLMALDTLAHTVSFYDRGAQPPGEPQFRYTEPEEGVLRLEGTFEEKPTTVVMRRTEPGALLVYGGYRWMNEYPFNR